MALAALAIKFSIVALRSLLGLSSSERLGESDHDLNKRGRRFGGTSDDWRCVGREELGGRLGIFCDGGSRDCHGGGCGNDWDGEDSRRVVVCGGQERDRCGRWFGDCCELVEQHCRQDAD